MLTPLLLLAALAQSNPAPSPANQPGPVPTPTPADPVETDWRPIADEDLLVIDLSGNRRVIIRLAPTRAPVHVANIRKLARAHWWDGTHVYRVQDNYVTQWGGGDDKTQLPEGVIENPPAEYEFSRSDAITPLGRVDPYAGNAGFTADGWPEIRQPWRSDQATADAWLPHCYGMVGVARDLAPSTGSGSELYTVIGHAPRHLDRNIALVGRVIEGMEHLSSLPRGKGNLGFHTDPALRTAIERVRLAADLPGDQRPRFDYRAAANPRFAAHVLARENREPPFFTVPAGGADVCNVPLPVRRRP